MGDVCDLMTVQVMDEPPIGVPVGLDEDGNYKY